AQVAGEPSSRGAFLSGGGVDVNEHPRQCDDVDVCHAAILSTTVRTFIGRNQVFRMHVSSSVRVSVRESRYLTMTGVASDSPHSTPFPVVTARAPGTTTAPSGITSGRSAEGLMISPRTRS